MVTDVHVSPTGGKGGEFMPFHDANPVSDGWERFVPAIKLCLLEGAESLLLLGDLAHLGDEETLERVIWMASRTGLPVWAVPGNHEAIEAKGALGRALSRAGDENARLLALRGERLVGGTLLAGLSIEHEEDGGALDIARWGQGPVVLLSHYPLVSARRQVEKSGLRYAGDREGPASVTSSILARSAPTVILSGHLHVRHTLAKGSVLQLLCAALVEPPFEVAIVDVEAEGGRVSVRRRSVPVAPSSNGAQLPVLSAMEEKWAYEDGSWVLIRSDGRDFEEVSGQESG